MIDRSPYAPASAQLVTEIFVRDIERSKAFYQQLGFTLAHDKGSFVTLTWEGCQLYLDQRPDFDEPPAHPQANVRIMVPVVDDFWLRAMDMGAAVLAPIDDREYGLRDFTILDPDGFGLRFGAWLDGD